MRNRSRDKVVSNTNMSGRNRYGLDFYSREKNTALKSFVHKYMRDEGAPRDIDVSKVSGEIRVTRADPVYNMHAYWSKKSTDAIRQFIEHFTQPGDLVLDPFCGSGSTALSAISCGRHGIAIDLSPAATFITKHYCTSVELKQFEAAFKALMESVQEEMDWLYETRCGRCGGNARTIYTVYSEVFRCERCWDQVAMYDCAEVKRRGTTERICPRCGAVIHARLELLDCIPVEVNYQCLEGCKPARESRSYLQSDWFSKYDLAKINEIENGQIPYWYPDNEIGRKFQTDRFTYKGVTRVCDFFTKRNLWALALVHDRIKEIERQYDIDDALQFVFNASLISLTKKAQHLKGGGGYLPGIYYLPPLRKERNVACTMRRVFTKVYKGKEHIAKMIQNTGGNLLISTQSATELHDIPSCSIDYVFTDPPYGNRVQFSELNYIWECWMQADTDWYQDEIIVNEHQGKGMDTWGEMMKQALSEMYRVLKPGRYLTITYHDSSEGTWSILQDAARDVGFVIERGEEVSAIDVVQKTFVQRTARNISQRDLVMVFRKPMQPQGLRNKEDESLIGTTLHERIGSIVRDYLREKPGSSIDRIWDEVVTQLVFAGEMEPHDFESILRCFAFEGSDGRWYLESPEQLDKSQFGKEEQAATMIRGFIEVALGDTKDSVPYADIFEFYLQNVDDKPIRSLKEFITDYFIPTDGGYRLPNEEEEERLRFSRNSGLNRKIARFIKSLESPGEGMTREVPDSYTLSQWVKHCNRNGLHEEAVILFEKGGLDLSKVDAETAGRVEEYYLISRKKVRVANVHS